MPVKKYFLTFLLFTSLNVFATESEPKQPAAPLMIQTTIDNIFITDAGIFVIDSSTDQILEVQGIIHSATAIFAFTGLNVMPPNAGPPCGHSIGCKWCKGCSVPQCIFRCNCR